MRFLHLALTVLFLLQFTLPAPLQASQSGEIENLHRRLEKLEVGEKPAEEFTIERGEKLLKFWGALEVEGYYLREKDHPDTSDLNIAEALLGISLDIQERLEGRIALIHEAGADPPVDLYEAYMVLSWPQVLGGVSAITAGLKYLPFGSFYSTMISDPLTLNLGEIKQTALMTSWGGRRLFVHAAAYNGNRKETGHNDIDNGMLAVEFVPTYNISFGLSAINDLANTKSKLLGTATAGSGKDVAAASGFLILDYHSVSATLEYLGALNKFSEKILNDPARAPELTGPRPRAWFAELRYTTNDDWEISGRFEKATDYLDNVARYGATFSHIVMENTVLSIEYLYSDYQRREAKSASQATVQLAMEF